MDPSACMKHSLLAGLLTHCSASAVCHKSSATICHCLDISPVHVALNFTRTIHISKPPILACCMPLPSLSPLLHSPS
jgi:hypothetical protein